MSKCAFAVLFFFAVGAWAQAPQITSYSTGVPGDSLYASGTTLLIYGTFTPESAGDDYTITVGGQTGSINFAFNAVVIVADIPANVPAGNTSLVITYLGQASNALPITISQLAPEFDSVTLDSTGETTPPTLAYNPFLHSSNGDPVTSSSPAALGEVIEALVTGIGSDVAPGVEPTITVAGVAAKVEEVEVNSSGEGGETVYFAVPATAPLGNDPVVVTVAGVASLSENLPIGSQTSVPAIFTNGTVSAASLIPGNPPPPLAPGSIATLFGSNLTNGGSCVSPCSQTLNSNGVLNTTMEGAQITINGTAVPIFFAVPGQLGFQVPYELTPSGTASIVVTVNGVSSAPSSFDVAPLSPGIFTTAASGTGQGAILNGAEVVEGISSLAAPTGSFPNAQPAAPGSVVVIFCTGLGQVSPAIATGVLPTGQTTVTQPTVTIGGLPATVQFSGLTPGDAGLYQINAVVPAAVQAGSAVQVVVTSGGVASNTVTIAVQ